MVGGYKDVGAITNDSRSVVPHLQYFSDTGLFSAMKIGLQANCMVLCAWKIVEGINSIENIGN